MYAQPIQSVAQSLSASGCSAKAAHEVTQSEVAAGSVFMRATVVRGFRLPSIAN